MNKRQGILAGLALLVLLLVFGGLYLLNREPAPMAASGTAEVIGPGEAHTMGNKDAKVTVIEYAAYTCPFCARFNNAVIPTLKEKYVASGKVFYVLRMMPIGVADGKAEGLAQCLPRDKFFDFADMLYRRQEEWGSEQMGEHANPPDQQPKTDAGLLKMARTAGLEADKARTCMSDPAHLERLIKTAEDANIRYGFNTTPTLIVNGTVHTRAPMSPEELSALLDPLLEGK
jgi:protein-disulfide isomerase